ncbi:MAG: bifunctional dTDP-4-dehydrorhamnose 3,5-epimerase family protein/NAD(P)-dependent oxidoreductase [Aeromicrobium sp.]|uniref:sugar nucleotide-binding protein n=1 Tax=Aeromicrobium sp. TaxID=1871063 RepID=UPI0039E4A17B
MTEFGKDLSVAETPIPGLLVIELPVHGDPRGWFKENWQREKLLALGVPDLRVVQNNISFNNDVGTTRGIHAEPWDKFVSVAHGSIFGAWVDLRAGDTFGQTFTAELGPDRAVVVPRGVGNSYQSLAPDTVYTYLVTDHWSAESDYTFLNLADETVAIDWPIPLDQCEISDKDRQHPPLSAVTPFTPRRALVVGANGQLGRALRAALDGQEHVDFADIDTLDITEDLSQARPWRQYDTIINAAAYTAVDRAETLEGRAAAWRVNVEAVANLARVATEHRLTLVHISSDYVFDGTTEIHVEDEPLTPLGVYGQTKAAGDLIASTVPQHYILRTSWVIGDGSNFVRTMASLAERGVDPRVVDDQHGRLTFSQDLAEAIVHLISGDAPYGVYNVSNDGPVLSWAQIARRVFELCGHDPERVTPVTTEAYYANVDGPVSPRPTHSTLDLAKIRRTGFTPLDADIALQNYLARC